MGNVPLRRGTIHRAQDAPSQTALAPALLGWAERYGRHDLPWQQQPTPYRVWVSEVMLQQTQVTIVLPYYKRFIARFPNVAALAAAQLDEVLSLWTGLGYYARARNLHRAAQLVMQEHDGRLPDRIDDLERLPGIGRSTAGAILALSSGRRHAILDGNARRVLARYFAVEGDAASPNTLRHLWKLAFACTPHERVAEYTQAIMDLGSGVCTRRNPHCGACPLVGGCTAASSGRQHLLPSPRRRRPRPERAANALVALNSEGAFVLRRQPAPGLWGGLWTFPMFDTEAATLAWCRANLPTSTGPDERLPPQRHAFTHFDLTLSLTVIGVDGEPPIVSHRWLRPRDLTTVGLSKAVTNLLPHLTQRFAQ